ncbi:MAG: hypothetical protein ACRDZR_18330 [Acidimicrobiales bacterium]
MTDSAVIDPRYAAARRVLLDALFALAPHGSAVIVAGAQAIYLHTGDADFGIAPFTTDGDLVIDPSLLGDDPELEVAMVAANFTHLLRPGGHVEPGTWVSPATIAGKAELIPVDLIVPEGMAPSGGRRSVQLGGHGNRAARRALGLEAALVDHVPVRIAALDPTDDRFITAEVAGPAALLVAKAHKINDRVASARSHRLDDKDASDVVRLMQTIPVLSVAAVFSKLLADTVAGQPTRDALLYLTDLFGRRGRPGVTMAVNALRFAVEAATVEVISTSYIEQLDLALGDV